jgi:CPA1 family monovalent cation:H+ antiporter
MHESILVTLAGVLLAAILCQWIAWRVRLPAIIFLLATGIAAGPLLGILDPDALLGDLLFPFVSLSVAVILFEGSLTLKFHEIRGLGHVIRRMITLGMLVTWLITTAATRLALGFSWEVAFLFGAIVVVTGPTVIVPMLRTVRPSAAVANILRWEGILIDPIGATLAVLVFEFIVAGGGEGGLGTSLLVFGKIVLAGLVIGASLGQAFGLMLRRHWIPHYLQNVAALAAVCAAFALANHLEAESGLLTVTVMGVWLANLPGADLDAILDFKESLSVLLISVLFIVLAARMDLERFASLGWPSLAVLAAIQFLARPLNAQIAALGSDLAWPERHLLAWIAPRGIVAAAIAALFALQLEALGYPDADLMVPLTFLVIIGTVVLQSATARPIARWLGVAAPEPRGLLIVGANRVTLTLARELDAKGVQVLLADDKWSGITEARLAGLTTYYGNPASEHAERHLNLTGIGRLLAITPSADFNTLCVQHYRPEFGPQNVFAIRTRPPGSASRELKSAPRRRGRTLFGAEVTFAKLASLLANGADLRTTRLTDTFTYPDYLQKAPRIPLLAIDPGGRLHVFTAETEVQPGAGWQVVGLTLETPETP